MTDESARAARTWAVRALSCVLVLALGGCLGASGDPDTETRPEDGSAVRASQPAGGPTDDSRSGGTSSRTARDPVPVRRADDAPAPAPPGPVRVEIPALDIDMPVRPVGVDDEGRMGLPDSADVAGWYRFGPAPASSGGATVVAAHVDDPDSVGPFARLADAGANTTIQVTTSDGTRYTYTAEQARAEAKSDVPFDELFDRSGPPRLVLVTCGGEWDPEKRSYSDNSVLTAALTDDRHTDR